MFRIIIFVIPLVLAVHQEPEEQLPKFKEQTQVPIGIVSTSNGAPVENVQASHTLNSRLIFNEFFMESMTHLSRERIPERVVHANGAGAFGYFEVTHDISHICKAKIFNSIGKKTPIAIRFSPVAAERGASDIERDARGFAVKFYSEDGNFDIVGLNMPVFVLKDPLFFPTFARSIKRNPASDLPEDHNMRWDFLTLHPETWNIFIRIFSDRGIPDGYRHMPGFSIHTYQVVNELGDSHFIRFHLVPNAGEKSLTAKQAQDIKSTNPDYNKRDLYTAILNGDFPSWTLAVQILSMDDVKTADFDIFDVTRALPLDKYPLQPVGQVVLNRNAKNYFAEIEQMAYSPANLVPGILGGADKLYEARRLSYRDTQYYRLGANFNNIRVNCPFNTKRFTYNRDGRPPVEDNGWDSPNYYPNTFNGPVPYLDFKNPQLVQIMEAEPDNMDQVRDYYLNKIDEEERKRLIDNISATLKFATSFLQERALALFNRIHPELGHRVYECISSNATMLADLY